MTICLTGTSEIATVLIVAALAFAGYALIQLLASDWMLRRQRREQCRSQQPWHKDAAENAAAEDSKDNADRRGPPSSPKPNNK
ncbi:hypothetical protein QCN27_19705 [Cereibacter sp. SYSU M97828]|nr:hypothetical protein [Cereibacter flavus]